MDLSIPDRKALLRHRGVKLSDIARLGNVSRGHVSRVVSGERHAPRVERIVARKLGMSLRDAFPEWYREAA